MCEFISAVKRGGQYYFLTRQQIDSPQGKILQLRFPGKGELIGHAAIRAYYDLDGGKDVEFTDFSQPANFPPAIVKALKVGAFRGFPFPPSLLKKPLAEDYQAKLKTLAEDYWDKRKPLDDDYQAKLKTLDDDYQAKRKTLDDDYWDKRKPLAEDYQAKLKTLAEDYQAKHKPLDDDYQTKLKTLDDDYWALFTISENRAELWRE